MVDIEKKIEKSNNVRLDELGLLQSQQITYTYINNGPNIIANNSSISVGELNEHAQAFIEDLNNCEPHINLELGELGFTEVRMGKAVRFTYLNVLGKMILPPTEYVENISKPMPQV